MRGPWIIRRYIFTEMLVPFLVSLMAFTLMLLLAKIMELTDMVVSRGVSLGTVGRLLLYSIPVLLHNTLPMATLLGVLLAFLRLSHDNELITLKTAGVSLSQLLPPVGALATLAGLATLGVSLWWMPWGYHQFESLTYNLARSRGDLVLKSKVFMNRFPGMVIYIGDLPGKGMMKDVFIWDQRNKDRPHTIVATRGRMVPAGGGRTALQLHNGTIHSVDQALKESRTVRFATYEIFLEAGGLSGQKDRKKYEKEMFLGELVDTINKMRPNTTRYYLALMELHKKFSMPVACLVMSLIGLSLGAHAGKGRSWGLGAALFIFMTYYLVLSLAWSLGDTGIYPPRLAVWMPNILLGVLGVVMFQAERKEAPLPFLDKLIALPGKLALWRKNRRAE